jgi:hypothetical protein
MDFLAPHLSIANYLQGIKTQLLHLQKINSPVSITTKPDLSTHVLIFVGGLAIFFINIIKTLILSCRFRPSLAIKNNYNLLKKNEI